jgi:hypothetical protein
MPNKYHPLLTLPDEAELKKIVSNFEYRKIENFQLPQPLRVNGLVQKCNSFIVAASGSTDGMLYSLIGIRPDKGNVIDEHPFVFYYDYNDNTRNFGGIIDHGDWQERTVPLDNQQLAAISASGLTASFTYKSIPPDGSGSLEDLRANNMLEGLSDQFEILFRHRPQTAKASKLST